MSALDLLPVWREDIADPDCSATYGPCLSARLTALALLKSPLSRPWLLGTSLAAHVGASAAIAALQSLVMDGVVECVDGVAWRLLRSQ